MQDIVSRAHFSLAVLNVLFKCQLSIKGYSKVFRVIG